MRLFKSCLGSLLCLGLLFSCSKDDGDDTNPNQDTVTMGEIDKTFFSQVKKSADEYDKNVIWNGYQFSKQSMYFVNVNSSGIPIRGFVINPSKVIDGMVKIPDTESNGLNLYRFDKEMNNLKDALANGNELFEFTHKIEGDSYYAQVYNETEVKDLTSISVAVHEVFHIYQIYGNNWQDAEGLLQDEKNYPITSELLPLQIMIGKIAEKMPQETNTNRIKKYLEMYVAIRSEEMRLDPTPQNLVKNMANNQEDAEGSAQYIEYTNAYNVFPEFKDPFEQMHLENLTKPEHVRDLFAFGLWYGTGAAVIYMLDNQGVDYAKEIVTNKTPFDVANDFLNLDQTQKEKALQDAKDEFNWTEIVNESTRLLNL